jgi:hypothetical protein
VSAVAAIINLNLVYIANETSTGEFACRHGPGECTGDMQQLCVRQYSIEHPELEAVDLLSSRSYPQQAPLWYEFAVCQSNTSYNIPANGQACAESLGYSWSEIDDCVTSGEGAKLLQASIEQIVPSTNDSISCTINMNHVFWCQHNDDWFGCTEGNTVEAFIASVCARYTGPTMPPSCQTRDYPTASSNKEQARPRLSSHHRRYIG